MKNYKIKTTRRTILWFSKEPVGFINSWNVEFKDGEIAHWNAYLHREDGPAIECPNGAKFWCWHGEYLNVNSQEEFERWKRFKNFE